jgi:putative membrane protein
MATIAWHDEKTKRRIEDLVREIESKSSAEVVVTVKPASGSYRAADVIFGAIMALVGLCIYVYAPIEFTDDLAPPSITLLFFAALACSARVPTLRRWFTPKSIRAACTRAAAREAFVDQNIACTRDRTGILIYVSTLEQRAEVVVDIGILRRENDGQPTAAMAHIERVIAEDGNLEAFEQAVREFGQWLAESLPPRIDDTNELADEVKVS